MKKKNLILNIKLKEKYIDVTWKDLSYYQDDNGNMQQMDASAIINVGANDGIKKDLAVIDIYGNLVGKVIEVGEFNSKFN